ncbi:MAG: hypothetical protein BGO25_13255 [Acidobacteriales bacterium 59-55]|nr:MAG: hypothetical protein BGO25_13255 [Acidobacteriales bacterium 59-55]
MCGLDRRAAPDGSLGEQDGEAVHDRVAAGAAGAEHSVDLKLEGKAADRAGQPAKVICREGAGAHGLYIRASGKSGGGAFGESAEERQIQNTGVSPLRFAPVEMTFL